MTVTERERTSEATKRMMRALGRALPPRHAIGGPCVAAARNGLLGEGPRDHAEALNDLADRLGLSGNTEAAVDEELRSSG